MSNVDFIREQTVLTATALVPEIQLYQGTEITPIWQQTEYWLRITNTSPPFWAFAWPGGQALARHILDNPIAVQGRRVLDFAAGCGIAAITAAKVGAKHVTACDIDPLALQAVQMNAAANQVQLETVGELDLAKPYKKADLILAGDVCYQQSMSVTIMRWLRSCAAAGVEVWLADPGRAYAPTDGLEELGRYLVPVSRELEDRDEREVIISRLTSH
jgi:predicted nicotinamide N-methyase